MLKLLNQESGCLVARFYILKLNNFDTTKASLLLATPKKALKLPGAGGRVQREAAADGHQRERQRQEEAPQEQVCQLPGRDQGQFAAQGRALIDLRNDTRPN